MRAKMMDASRDAERAAESAETCDDGGQHQKMRHSTRDVCVYMCVCVAQIDGSGST